MTIQDELIVILNQIPAAIEKAFNEAMVLRHPGHANQKTHGNRFGAGQAKESLRRLKDDKGARERYKETHRKRGKGGGGSGSDFNDPATISKEEFNRRAKDVRGVHEERGIARLSEPIGSGKGVLLVTVPKAQARRIGQNKDIEWVSGTDRGLVYQISNTKEAISNAKQQYKASVPRGIKAGYFVKIPAGAKVPKVEGFFLYTPPIFGKDWTEELG